MDKRKQKDKKTAKRNLRIQRANSEEIRQKQRRKKEKSKNNETDAKNKDINNLNSSKKNKPGRKQDPKGVEFNDSDLLKITVEHFFKNKINDLIDEIDDPRDRDMCTYELTHLTWLGILMFLFRLKSRNQLLKEKDKGHFLENLLSLSASDEEYAAHPDTMNYLFEIISYEKYESLKTDLVKILMKNKVLDKHRLFGSYRIAIDATDLFTFKTSHCENCLVQKHNDNTTTYSHKMLEAKLVSELGFAFSVCSESIENVNGKYDKQDCELKAFYRMEEKLKKLFPRTQICILLDGLYACKEVFDICKKNGWGYIIVLKPKKIPTLYKKALEETTKYPNNTLLLEGDNEKEEIKWCCHVDYNGRKLHVVFSKKTTIEDGEITIKKDSWVTNIVPRKNNIEKLIKKGGRQRWKIENQGFKEQKCDDYELEHLYGEKANAWKIYYQLLQIAHLITQLIRYSDLFQRLQEHSPIQNNKRVINSFKKYYNTIGNFVLEMRRKFISETFSELTEKLRGKIQIRFSSG